MLSTQAKYTLSITGASIVAIVAGSLLVATPSGAQGPPVPGRVWHTSGNLNTSPPNDYLGTADATDLVLATLGMERIRILATGETIVHHDLHVGEDLSVDGLTTLNDLEVGNDLAIAGNLSVQGHTSLQTLSAADNVMFQANMTVNGHSSINSLNVSSLAVFTDDVLLQGNTEFFGNASFFSAASFSSDVAVGGDLDVSGTTRTGVLEILGADLAEEFPFSAPVRPGMVVEIDPDNAGQLRPASGAYNRRVAGVVAGANEFSTGIVLGRGSGNELAAPVALTGRVYVYVDATNRAVEVGDMLTTSDRPGYAMAVRDYSAMHGAVIGKAMTPLAEGETGLVLVLVNLQ